MLQRQIDIGRDLGKIGDGVQETIVGGVRVAVEHAHPVHALDGADGLEKFGQQQLALGEIVAVAGGVLRDQRDFRHTARGQFAAFLDDAVKGARVVRPADEGDGAVAAAVVAAVGNFHVGGVGGRGQHALGVKEAFAVADVAGAPSRLGLPHHFQQARVVRHAHEAVHLGHFAVEVVDVALGEAAGDEQLFEPARLLVLRHLENGLDGFLLGRLDEAAGVDEDDLRLGGVGDDLVARLFERSEDHFAVHAVLGAAERDHAHLLHCSSPSSNIC